MRFEHKQKYWHEKPDPKRENCRDSKALIRGPVRPRFDERWVTSPGTSHAFARVPVQGKQAHKFSERKTESGLDAQQRLGGGSLHFLARS